MVEVDKCCRESERHVFKLLACANLQVDRHTFKVVVVSLELSAEVACHGRNRPFCIGVVVVQTEVNPHSQRVVAANVRCDESGCNTACYAAVEHVREVTAHGNVLGGKIARLLVVGVSLPHCAVIDKLSTYGPRDLFAHVAVERCACCHRARHVGHEVESDGLVAYRRQQGGIVERKRSVVLDKRSVVATQRRSVCAYRKAQKIIQCLAFLGAHCGDAGECKYIKCG